jgi:hypothetical protein
MNVWFNASGGIGDHIIAMSAVVDWLSEDESRQATVAYFPSPHSQAILNHDRVSYIQAEEKPDDSFLDAMEIPMSRNNKLAAMGLKQRRYHYVVTPQEAVDASGWWRTKDHPEIRKICVQWHGSCRAKMYAHWDTVLDWLTEFGDADVIVLDQWGEYEGKYFKMTGERDVRFILSLAATADLFLGFDSGPFYAALGNGVPSFAFFGHEPPENLGIPPEEPKMAYIFQPTNLVRRFHIIDSSRVIEKIETIWERSDSDVTANQAGSERR